MITETLIRRVLLLAACATPVLPGIAAAATTEDPAKYQSRAIRWVVPFPP